MGRQNLKLRKVEEGPSKPNALIPQMSAEEVPFHRTNPSYIHSKLSERKDAPVAAGSVMHFASFSFEEGHLAILY